MKPFCGFHEGMVKPPAIKKGVLGNDWPQGPMTRGTVMTTMADRSGLKLVGLIFGSIWIAVTLATTAVVAKSYADGVYALESARDSR
jgi:hypothetical protein